jgi:hypothetical protein
VDRNAALIKPLPGLTVALTLISDNHMRAAHLVSVHVGLIGLLKSP